MKTHASHHVGYKCRCPRCVCVCVFVCESVYVCVSVCVCVCLSVRLCEQTLVCLLLCALSVFRGSWFASRADLLERFKSRG